MALPTILVNSGSGSDTQASGAGPATALFGSTGITSADGLTVSLLTDNPDLSGVATDGSAVIFMSDTAAGARNFGKITAVDNTVGVKTVTVANAFGLTNTDAWAIGGKRASIGSTTSKKLFDNNGAAGDMLPGWICEMESAHAETLAAELSLRRAGDTTSGPIILRGVSGAATTPILTFSNNSNGVVLRAVYCQVRDFELRNTNATKTASIAVNNLFNNNVIEHITINHATNKFWKACTTTSAGIKSFYKDNIIANCANIGMDFGGPNVLMGNLVSACGSSGIQAVGDLVGMVVEDNIVVGNSGDGMRFDSTTTTNGRTVIIRGNTIDSNTGDGIEFIDVMSDFLANVYRNNIISNNGGVGVNYSGAGVTAIGLSALGVMWTNNDMYNNTGGASTPSGISMNDPNVDPQFTGGGDYSIGTNLKALGYPTRPIGT